MKNISLFSLYKSISPFDRRITFIEWHPKYPEVIAAASKGGDILLWNYGTTVAQQLMIRGVSSCRLDCGIVDVIMHYMAVS
jgi:hypothetical protein